MYVENFSLSSADWIASAGVVASVAAIFAAWWTTHRQVSAHSNFTLAAENRSLERDKQALQGIVTVAAAQYLKLSPAMSGHEPFHYTSFLFTYDECSFDNAISALDQVPLKDLGSCDLVVAINGMKTGMVHLRLLVRQAEEFARNRDEPQGHSIKSDGRNLIKRLDEHYRKATEILGGGPITSFTWMDD